MRETEFVWLVEKNKSFFNKNTWKASHTFDTLEDVFLWVGRYLEDGSEPLSRAAGRT
jgi:hypothetical protein